MPSQTPTAQLPSIAKLCGRSLIFIFLVTLIAGFFPISIKSPIWGTQLSNRILDGGVLPLLGVALLRVSSSLQLDGDSRGEREASSRSTKRGGSVRRLTQIGVISMVLLAVWQVILFGGNIDQIDQQRTARSQQLTQRLSAAEQSLREAPQSAVDQAWQRLSSAGFSALPEGITSQEEQREALLERIRTEQQQANLAVSQQGAQARFALMRNLARNLLLCGVYITAYRGLGKGLGKR
jgi:hypothetical protein